MLECNVFGYMIHGEGGGGGLEPLCGYAAVFRK